MSSDGRDQRETQTTLRRLQHDLRTPLGQIIGYSELVEEELEDRGADDLTPDLQRIRAAAERLLELVNSTFAAETEAALGGPAQMTRAKPASGESEDVGAAELGGSILVVDDEPANRDMLARRLERAGYKVETAEGGVEALRTIDDGAFDLVLLDVNMPGMDGLEVLRVLRRTRSLSELPVVLATALDSRDELLAGLRAGANDYVTKPLDMAVVLARASTQIRLRRTVAEKEGLSQQLEIRNAFMRRTFGRYVSDEVVSDVLERPEGLELRGESRRITALVADLRGFSSFTGSLPPVDVVSLLNHFLGPMSEAIQEHGGTLDNIVGDEIVALFGAPIAGDDDAQRAVACALAMQRAMEPVNERNRSSGLPDIEMGVGLATGDAIVGNIGSELRAKYTAIGNPVTLAARIESYTTGGQVLVDDETRGAVGDALRVTDTRLVHPKGMEEPLRVHQAMGLQGRPELDLREERLRPVELPEPLAVRFAVLEGKHVGEVTGAGRITDLSPFAAEVGSDVRLEEMSNLRLEIPGERESDPWLTCYAKAVEVRDGGFTLRLTTRNEDVMQRIDRLLEAAAG